MAPSAVPLPLPSRLPTSVPTFAPSLSPTTGEDILVSRHVLHLFENDDGEEARGAATFTVELTNAPSAPVFVNVTAVNRQVQLTQLPLRLPPLPQAFVGPFTALNWYTPVNVTVSAVNDAFAEWSFSDDSDRTRFPGHNGDDLLLVVGYSPAPGDSRYHGLVGASVVVLIQDDDEVGLELLRPARWTSSTDTFTEAWKDGQATLVSLTQGTVVLDATEGPTSPAFELTNQTFRYGMRLLSRPFGRVVVGVSLHFVPSSKNDTSGGMVVTTRDRDTGAVERAVAPVLVSPTRLNFSMPSSNTRDDDDRAWAEPREVTISLPDDYTQRPDKVLRFVVLHRVVVPQQQATHTSQDHDDDKHQHDDDDDHGEAEEEAALFDEPFSFEYRDGDADFDLQTFIHALVASGSSGSNKKSPPTDRFESSCGRGEKKNFLLKVLHNMASKRRKSGRRVLYHAAFLAVAALGVSSNMQPPFVL